jgi:hypothetical protein
MTSALLLMIYLTYHNDNLAVAETIKSSQVQIRVVPATPPPAQLCTVTPSDSPLKVAARAMNRGDWRKVDVTYSTGNERQFFYTSPYITPIVNQSTQHLDWANSAGWDPFSRCLYFYGGGHLTQPAFVKLCESDLRWKYEIRPGSINYNDANFWSYVLHAYSTNATDSDNGIHYFARFGNLYGFDTRRGIWTVDGEEAPPNSEWGGQTLAYFKNLGLIAIRSSNPTLHVRNPTTKAWTQINANLSNLARGSMTARYNPTSNVLLFSANGSSSFYKLDANRNVSVAPNPPTAFAVNSGTGFFTEDPSSGNFIYVAPGSLVYEYVTASNSWISRGSAGVSFSGSAITTSIPEYGVIAYYIYGQGLWLFKPNGARCP